MTNSFPVALVALIIKTLTDYFPLMEMKKLKNESKNVDKIVFDN